MRVSATDASLRAGRQAVLPDVVQVMDDRDHPRGEEEEGRGRQDLDGGPPERHGGDGEGDEEGNHFGFLTGPWRLGSRSTGLAAGSAIAFSTGAGTMFATTGPLSGFGSGARHGRWANIGRAFLCMQFAGGVRVSVDSLVSSPRFGVRPAGSLAAQPG